MEKSLRKKYYNLCDPYKTLPLDSGYVLDIDNYVVDGKKVNARGKVWADEIADKISWSDEPQVVYFTGYTGSGKTTELKRVINILEREDDANLLGVYINCLDFFDINARIELVDILSVIVYNVTLAVAKYKGKSEDNAFDDSDFFTRIWSWLQDTDVNLKSVELDTVSPAKLIFEMKNRPDFRKRVKANIFSDITKFKKDVFVELDRLNSSVKSYQKNKKQKDGIVVVVDSLEKNRGIGEEVDFVADTIEKLFKDRESLTLPFSTIYTIPGYLSTRHINDIYFLPVVRIFDKKNKHFKDGISLMKSLVYDRIPKEDIEQLISDELLEKIILFSGGYPRDLLKMLQKILILKEFPVKEEDIDFIFKDLENEYKEAVPSQFIDKLIEINSSHSLDLSVYEQRTIAYELFSIHAILRYRNGDLWWGLHPALKKILNIEDSDG